MTVDIISPDGYDKKKAQKCLEKINLILKQYECVMIPEMIFSGKNFISRVLIQPKPSEIIPNMGDLKKGVDW